MIRVNLKYGPNGERVIQHIERVSTPGCRVYSKVAGLKPVLQGMGITILTTSQGLLSDRECLAKKLGGEVLCRVW
jgi:small subunit ribosomal protein S8